MKKRNRFITKTFKFFLYLTLVFLVIMIVLSVVVRFKQNEITRIVLDKINESTRIPIAVKDVSMNIVRRFPLATIKLEEVWVGMPALKDSVLSKSGGTDTLAFIEKIFISVKSKPLLKREVEIMMVEVIGLDFDYLVDKHGISNLDFLKDTTQKKTNDTSAFNLTIMLRELRLRDIHCSYHDSVKKMHAVLDIPTTTINGGMNREKYFGAARGLIHLSQCDVQATKMNQMKTAGIEFDLNYRQDTIHLSQLELETEGAYVSIVGDVIIKDTIAANINLKGSDLYLPELYKYVPDDIIKKAGIRKIGGFIQLDAHIQGFVSDSLVPRIEMDVELKDGLVQMVGYPVLKNIAFTSHITNGKHHSNETTTIDVQTFYAETDHSKVKLSLDIANLDRIQYNLKSQLELDAAEMMMFVPDSMRKVVDGKIYMDLSTYGSIPDSMDHAFTEHLLQSTDINMALENVHLKLDSAMTLDAISGKVKYNRHHIMVSDLQAQIPGYQLNVKNTSFDALVIGKINDLSTLTVDLKSFKIHTDKSYVTGAVKIRNLKEPEFYLKSDLKVDLMEFGAFLPDTLIKEASGTISTKITMRSHLNMDSIKSQLNEVIFNNSEFQLQLENIALRTTDTLINISDFTGNIHMKNDVIQVDGIKGAVNGMDFHIQSAVVTHLYKSLLQNQATALKVEGDFHFGELDYTSFLPFLENKNENSDAQNTIQEDTLKTKEKTNYTWQFKGKLGINSLTYKNAKINNITGLINASDSLYLLGQFKFDGFEGSFNTSVRYEVRKQNENVLWVKNKIRHLDIYKLLKDFENFKDFYTPEITYDNISGFYNSNIDAQIYLKNNALLREKMYIRVDSIKLEKGIIKNYEPVKAMEPLLLGIDNLDELDFKTIKSSIFVFQDTIYVPSTLIVSNKLDAKAFGQHSFNGYFNYQFEVYLSDIITGKAKRINKKQSELGDEIDVAGRKGRLLQYVQKNNKRTRYFSNEKTQSAMRSNVKTAWALLLIRFHPARVSYDTNVE